ncbi:RHS repeat-associated core domain-containing protein, partial [Luteimonas sp. Y-2-2-4F]
LLVGEATGFGGAQWGLGYGYDAHGSLASMTYPNNLSVSYAPNALGQPTRVGDYATQARYHPNGAMAGFTYGNGVAWTMTQNARGLPHREDSAGVQRYEYWYDANGNPTHLHDQTRGNAYSRNLQYDAADRLTGAGSASFGGDHWHRFKYDALDNLYSWTHAGVKDYSQYVYDHNFRVIQIRNAAGAAQVTLSYDAQGNVAQRNGRAHVFDYGNRLLQVPEEWYTYDAHGRRQLACSPSACNYHHYGQDGKLYYSNNNRTGRRENYLYLGDKQVAIREAAVGNNNQDVQVKYQHTDLLGSPVAITDAAGTVLERTHWAPYGAAIDKPAYDGIGYTGHRQDGATGLVYMQQRYYDPQIGRFLSVDPVTAYDNGDMRFFNRYSYAANAPYAFIDPDGREIRPVGTRQEIRAINRALRKIERSNPASRDRMQAMRNSDHVHTIRFPQPGESPENKTIGDRANEGVPGVGTGSETIVDPTSSVTTVNRDGARITSSGEAVLAHELLGHGGDKDNGVMDRSINPATGERRSEERAMDAENEYKDAIREPRRDCHSTC